MNQTIKHLLQSKGRKASGREIDPDEIFLDSSNLPEFDTSQFEGRIEKPISKKSLLFLGICFLLVGALYMSRVWHLQVALGASYNVQSENNRLKHTLIFSPRGIITDRNNVELAWNEPGDTSDITLRKYSDLPGLAHVLGYVQYPSKDKYGFYYREDFVGMDGVEKYYNDTLKGANGLKIIEVNALEQVQSESVIQPPKEGANITLSIDSRLQSELFSIIKKVSEQVKFSGGAGIIMNVQNGEVLALASYPEYDPEVLSTGTDNAAIKGYLTDKNKPFLNRVIDGVYAPGSIVKPIIALGALNEHVIDPMTKILSTGSISLQNQYNPKLETVFKDWRAQGYVDMRHALAVSSDVYFYEVGGGYKDQKGLGITNIEKYLRMFGLGEAIPNSFFTGSKGIIPTPDWKKLNFNGEGWTLGDTYHTAIGQYGFQATPLQMVRVVSAIANGGKLIYPTILKNDPHNPVESVIPLPQEDFQVIHEGMRLATLEGTAVVLNVPYVQIAAKSGTAELGVSKDSVNSWVMGYFPYDNPKYAFAIAMEKGQLHNVVGSGVVMRDLIDWMHTNTPEYFEDPPVKQ